MLCREVLIRNHWAKRSTNRQNAILYHKDWLLRSALGISKHSLALSPQYVEKRRPDSSGLRLLFVTHQPRRFGLLILKEREQDEKIIIFWIPKFIKQDFLSVLCSVSKYCKRKDTCLEILNRLEKPCLCNWRMSPPFKHWKLLLIPPPDGVACTVLMLPADVIYLDCILYS